MSTSMKNLWQGAGIVVLLAMVLLTAHSATFTQNLTIQPSTSGDVILRFKATPTVGVDVVYDVFRKIALVPPGSFADPADKIATGAGNVGNPVVLINTQSQFTNGVFGTHTTSDAQPYYYQVRAQDVNGVGTRLAGTEALSVIRGGVADVNSPDDLRNNQPDFVGESQDFVPTAILNVVLPPDSVLNADSPLQAGTISQIAEPSSEFRFHLAWFRKAQSTNMQTAAQLPAQQGIVEIKAGPFDTYDISRTAVVTDTTGMESGTEYNYFVQVEDTVGNRNGFSGINLDQGHLESVITAISPVVLTGDTLGGCSVTVISWLANPNSLTTDPANLNPSHFRVYAASSNTPILSALDLSTATLIGDVAAPSGVGGASTPFSFTHDSANAFLPRISGATYAYCVIAVDELGRTGPLSDPQLLFAADTVPPDLCQIFDPVDGATVSGTIPVQANVKDNACGGSGIDRTDFYITDVFNVETFIGSDDTDFPGANTTPVVHAVSLDTTVFPMGYYVLSATTFDFGGNALGSSNNPTVFIDNTVPEVAITSPAPGAYVNNVLILSGTAFDVSGITLVAVAASTSIGTLNGVVTGNTNWTATLDLSGVPGEEAITVTATATDGVGSTGNSAPLGLVTDSSGPVVDTFTCPTWISAASALLGITVTAGATDPDAVPAPAQAGVLSVTLSANNADAPDTINNGNPNTQTFTFSTVTPVEGNSLEFTADADDNALDQRAIAAGVTANPCRPNIGPASTCESTFDLTGPLCEITSPLNNFISTLAVPFNVIGYATDALSGLSVLSATIVEEINPLVVLAAVNNTFPGAPNASPFNFNIDPGMDGVFIITVTVYDQVGNFSVCTVRVIRDSQPPTAGVFPLPPDVCTSIVVCGTASDVFGTISGVTVTWNEYIAGILSGTGVIEANQITGATNNVEWCVDPFLINAGLPDGATIEISAFASTTIPDEVGPSSAPQVVTVDITPPVSAILGAVVVDGSATPGIDPTVLAYVCSSGMLVAGTAEDFGGAILGPPGVIGVNGFYQVATGPSSAYPSAYNNTTGNWSVLIPLAGIPSGSTFELGSQAQDAATSCQTLEALNIFDATFVVDCVPPDLVAVTNIDGLCLPGSAFPLFFVVNLTEQPSPFHVGLSSAEFLLDGVVVYTDLSIQMQSIATSTGVIALPPDGVHTITVVGYDLLGNAGTLAAQTFTVDTIPPVALLTQPPAYCKTVNVQTTLAGSITDVGCGVASATVTYTDLASDTVVSVSPDAAGNFSLLAIINPAFVDGTVWQATIEAEDDAGNIMTPLVRTFTVDTEAPGTLALNMTGPGCVNGVIQFQAAVSDSSAAFLAASLGYADSGIRYATGSVYVNGVATDVAASGRFDPPLFAGPYGFGFNFDTSTLPFYGAVSGDTFRLILSFEDGPCDIGNVASVSSASLTWDITPPEVQITQFEWPNGDRIETVTGGAYLISCASEPFNMIGTVTDVCGVSQVEIFYSTDTSDPGNDTSLGLATVDLAGSTFELTGVSVPSLLQGNGSLWAIASDDIVPPSGTPNVNARADVVSASAISIFVDTLPPDITYAAAMPFAATSGSGRSITLTVQVCDGGTGVDANAPIALTAVPKTVNAVQIGLPVPPGAPAQTSGTTLSKMAVPLLGTISTLAVNVNITHTYRGDLELYLTSPGGTTYQFKTSNIGDGADNVIGSFDVSAGFAGEEIHGTWTLTMRDVFFGDSGQLNSWSLTATGAVQNVVLLDPNYQAIDLLNPDPAPMAANFLATSATCATYTLTFSLPLLTNTEGAVPLDIAAADLGGCTVAATRALIDGFMLLIDNTAPAPNLPDPDPLAVDPADFDYPSDDTIAQIGGSGGPFRWDYDDPLTWTDNELRNPNAWDQNPLLNSPAVRLAASQPLTLAGKLLVAGQARDNSGVVQSGVERLRMFWTYGDPSTPPPPSAFVNVVPAFALNLTPGGSNAPANFNIFFDANTIVGTFYIKTQTTDYAGNMLDPIFGPFLGVDVMAPLGITWLRATTHIGSSDVLLDWHLGGQAPDNVGTVGYEIYRTKFAVQDLFGLTPADFDRIDIISATNPVSGQETFTYLDQIPGAGIYGYYIVGFDAAGNGMQGAPIPGNPSNRVAAMKNDIVDPLPVNNLRVVGNQPDTTVRLSFSIPDDPLTFAPFDGDNVGIAQFKVYRRTQDVPLVDGDPDDLDEDLVPQNLVGILVNNYLPTAITEERASLNGADTQYIVLLSPPADAGAVTRVFNQRVGCTYDVVGVVDRTVQIAGGPDAPLPSATDTVLVDYKTWDRVFRDQTVAPSKHYAYAVIAQDAAENNSDISGMAEDSTGTALDTTPPDAITQLAVTSYVDNTTLTLEWPTTPYDNAAVIGYNILASTAPIFDINNPGKDSRVVQLAGLPKIAYAASATPSVTIPLQDGDIDLGTLVVTDLTNGATVPNVLTPGVNLAVDAYWSANLPGTGNTVTVFNIPAEALDVPIDDGSTYPANLSVAYFNAKEILYDAGTNTYHEQLAFSFDPTIHWGTDSRLENETLYFVVMAVDPSGNQADISNIVFSQVTPIPPLAPIAYIQEVSPAKRYLPGIWVGGPDIVFATLADPVRDSDVVAIEVYSEDPGVLSFVNSATTTNADGWYEIPVGDNLYPKLFVIAVDGAGNRSEATVLFNDIVAPAKPVVDRALFNPAPIADLIYGFATVDTVQVHLYNDPGLTDLVAVAIPSSTGAWNFVIPDITPEFVFATALDAASNESKAAVIDVLPDAPLVTTDPRVLEVPPLRTRYIVPSYVVVTTGGPDRVQGTVSDPDVKRVNVYSDQELVQLEFSGIPSATGWFDIPIGDNYLPVCWVSALDSAGHKSAAVRLDNDIVAPPVPVIDQIVFNPAPTPDIIRGFVSLDTVTLNVYNDFELYALIGSFAITPGPDGKFEVTIADITPEFVFTAALDSVSNESNPSINPVIPDPPIVFTDPRVHEVEPLRTRYIVPSHKVVTTGGPDYIEGRVTDPQVVQVQVYRDDELDTLAYWGVPSATGYFKILIGDNDMAEAHVVAVDSSGHTSPFVRLLNDIVAPPPPIVTDIIFNATPAKDIIRGFVSLDTIALNVYNDFPLYEQIAAFKVTPGPNGEFEVMISDITPEFVFTSALDSVSNESQPHINPVIPDPPIILTYPTVLENPPIRVRESVVVGEVDYVVGYTNDPQVVKIEVYRDADLNWPGDLVAEQVLAGTNHFKISIGDNLYPEVFVVAVDGQNHRSPAVKLTNDIIPPPVLAGITLELYEANNPDYIPPRPDIVRGFSTPDTTLIAVYADPELNHAIGTAVPANGQWSVTATEDILQDFIFVTTQDGTINGVGLGGYVYSDGRRHPGNESYDLEDETVPAERQAARIRVPNSPPIVYNVEVHENAPGLQDTVTVTSQRGLDEGWDPDTEVEIRVFSVMKEGAPNVVSPFATLINDVRDMDTDLANNLYLAVDTQVLQLTQDGHTRVFFQAAGTNPRTLYFDHRNTGRLLLGASNGQISVVNVSGFVPGTPLGAAAVLASFNSGITGDDLVGPVVDPANSSAASLRLVYASRASGDIKEVAYNVAGNSFGAASTRHTAASTGINSPQSLAFNLTGDLFVGDVRPGGGTANPFSDRVVRVRPTSGRTTVMAKNLTLPTGMSIDVAGDLYINQLTFRNIGLRGEVVVYRPFETEVGATLLRSIHTPFEGQPLRPVVDPAGRMYFGSRTGANVSYVYQGVLSARFPWGPDSGDDGVPDAWGKPITPVQSPQSQTAPDGQITFPMGDNEHAQIAVIAVRRGGFSTGVPVLASNDIVEPQPPVAQVADAVPPLQDSVSGYAERKSTVVIYGDQYGTNDLRSYNVGDSGNFFQLFLGNNYLPDYWIASIDKASNRSVLNLLPTDITIDVPRLDKLTVICGVPGTPDWVRGDPFAVEGFAWVRIYSNPELTHLVNSPVQAAADGSFLYNIGDNLVSDMWLIAVDPSGNISRPVRLHNDTEGPALNPGAIQVLAHEQGAQDFVVGLAGAVEANATVLAYLDAGLTLPAPDPVAVSGLDGAFGTLNMGDDTSPIIEMTGTPPFQTPRRSFFLVAYDEWGNKGPVLELDNRFVPGHSPVDIAKIKVWSRETLLHDSVEGIYGAVEPFSKIEVFYDVFFTQPVAVGGVAAATTADQWGQFGPIDLGDDQAAAFYLKVTDAYGNVSAPVKIYNPFVPGISVVDPLRITVFSNQNGIDDFVIGIAGAVEPRAEVAIFFDAAFTQPVPGAVATADDHGAFGPISLGNDLATEFYLRAIDELGHVSSPYRLFNPYVENPVAVNVDLIEVISNEELVPDYIVGKSGAVEPRDRVLIFKTIDEATAIGEDPVTHVVTELVPDVVARAFRAVTANDFGGFGPVNVGDDESTVFYLRVIDETNHISSPLLLRNPLVPGVVDVDPFRIRVVANQEGQDDYIVGDTGAVEPLSKVEVFTVDFSLTPGATPIAESAGVTVDQYGRFLVDIGDDTYRSDDDPETIFWLRFTDPIGHLSPPYRVVNPFVLGTQRPDVLRIHVVSNPQGQDDLVVGVDGAVEANAVVRIYSDAGLGHLVATGQADMWGAFGPISVGDDVSTVFYLVAIDNLGNQSSALRLENPFVPNNPQAASFGFVVLDGFGGIHTRNVYDSLSNAAHQNVGVPHPFPIFQALAPVLDGFFALRGDGVIEALGNAPLVDQVSMPNYPELFTGDYTRAVDIQAYEWSNGHAQSMYTVDAYGQVYTSKVYGEGSVPDLSEPALYYDRVVKALQLVRDSDGDPIGTLVMDSDGDITARGGSNFSGAVASALGHDLLEYGNAVDFDVKVDSNNTITGLLVLGEDGEVVSVGDAPQITTHPAIAGGLARDIELDPTGRGYYIMDGLGGILTVGDITPLLGAPYFGFDIARDLRIVHAKGGQEVYTPPYPEEEAK